jgi:hypothetical protein
MNSISLPRRRLAAIAAGLGVAAVVAAGALVAQTTASGSSDPKPTSDLPAPVETVPGYDGAVTDSGPNPWMMNDPEWALDFLARYCPEIPPLTPEMTDEISAAVKACIASRPAVFDDIASPL